jgi:hypothetical protein
MEHMTPEQLGVIVVGTLAIIFGRMAWGYRLEIADWFAARLPRRAPVSADYVAHAGRADVAPEAPFTALNSPERPAFVQPEQLAQAAERATIDAAARFMAAHNVGEAAVIELLFDGVKRGGSKRYTDLRDAVRARAQLHGWQAPAAPEPPRVVRVYEGRPDERLVEL